MRKMRNANDRGRVKHGTTATLHAVRNGEGRAAGRTTSEALRDNRESGGRRLAITDREVRSAALGLSYRYWKGEAHLPFDREDLESIALLGAHRAIERHPEIPMRKLMVAMRCAIIDELRREMGRYDNRHVDFAKRLVSYSSSGFDGLEGRDAGSYLEPETPEKSGLDRLLDREALNRAIAACTNFHKSQGASMAIALARGLTIPEYAEVVGVDYGTAAQARYQIAKKLTALIAIRLGRKPSKADLVATSV